MSSDRGADMMPAMRALRRMLPGVVSVLCVLLCVSTAAARSAPLRFGAPQHVDHATAYGVTGVWYVTSLSCPSTQLCVGIGGDSGQVETSTDPASPDSWHGRVISPRDGLEGVSCPSVSLCVAVTIRGNILTSTEPLDGAWTPRTAVIANRGVSGGISCPSVSLCVAVDGGSEIVSSSDPQAGDWQAVTIAGSPQLLSVSCPSVSLCVAVDFDGNVVTSTDPTGPASAWTVTDLGVADPTTGDLAAVSCGAVDECVIADDYGNLISSSDPAGGAHAWTVARADEPAGFPGFTLAVSCLAGLQCVAADGEGNVLHSDDPAAGDHWVLTPEVDPDGLTALDCPSAALCVAGDGAGGMLSSPDLGATWTIGSGLGSGRLMPAGLVTLSCPRVTQCVALDGDGNELTSVDPAGGVWHASVINRGFVPGALSCTASGFCEDVGAGNVVAAVSDALSPSASWRLADLSRYPPGSAGDPADESLNGVSCVSASLCVATRFDSDFGDENIEVSRDPGGSPTSWRSIAIGQPRFDDFTGVSCAATTLCVATDSFGDKLAVSTDDATRWHLLRIPGAGAGIVDVSCPSVSFCAAVGNGGQVLTSESPRQGGAGAWRRARIDAGHDLSALACASRALCAAIDDRGNVLVSSDPPGGAATWQVTATGQSLTAVSCPSARLCVLSTAGGGVILGRPRAQAGTA